MLATLYFSGASLRGQNGIAVSAQAHIAKRCERPKACAEAKKKARRINDAPSNKNVWQLLVGTFIVVKRAWLQTAPLLDFSSLRAANIKMYQQLIHNYLWMSWG
jgi:hypothetical protein